MSNFSHLSGVHLLRNAGSANTNVMVNAKFIESRNTSECNDVFCKSMVQSSKKLFELKVFVTFLEQWSNPASESTSLTESFAM